MLKPALKTFLAVCSCGSFSGAAAALYVTPSAVIQQIKALEAELGVTLFVRSPRGVTCTQAGTFLFTTVRDLAMQSEDILRRLHSLAASGSEICVGTSLLEKCRLLYNLWILFSQEQPAYEITMVNIDTGHLVPERAELVESVNGEVSWTKSWNFFEICKVPFGFAFHPGHPLARKKVIRPEDLRGETVMSINQGTSACIQDMLAALRSYGVHVIYPGKSSSSSLWESSFNHNNLVVPLCWGDILINMQLRSCQWDKAIPYGIFYRPSLSPAAAEFLQFIRQSYAQIDLSDLFTC